MLATAGVVAPSMAQYKFWVHTHDASENKIITEYSIAETDSISYTKPNVQASGFSDQALASSFDNFDSAQIVKSLSSEEDVDKFVKSIFGPFSWQGFDKFSWLAGDVLSGNVYQEFFDEGQFLTLQLSPYNSYVNNGFQSLYGVIAKCNQIINELPAACKANDIDIDVVNRVIGEAKMYRGLAYFYLTEYWGAVPLVLKSERKSFSTLSIYGACNPRNNVKADRATLYTQIEKDWHQAYDLLPDSRQKGCRPWKASAAGMLTKLYVTMASCQTEIEGDNNYVCADPNEMYKKAIDWANKTLGLVIFVDYDYDKLFWPNSESPEIIFALNFEEGEYGAGSSRQIEFARSKHVAGGGNAYGGEKGLTVMLFNSYEKGDIRLDATAYYNKADKDWYDFSDSSWVINSSRDKETLYDAEHGTGHYYEMYDGSRYYYFLNPNKSLSKSDRDQFYGNEPLSPVLNNCRKFVYGMKLSENEFSAPITFPVLRTADVYLLLAEAKMGLESLDVASESTAGLEEVNTIRERAGLPSVDKIAFCVPDEVYLNAHMGSVVVNDKYGYEMEISASCDQYYPTYDLMMERRHEFALEGQNWLDIKRLYYRNPDAAKNYIMSQDRSYKFGVKYGFDIAGPKSKSDFQRQELIHKLSQQAHEISYSYTYEQPEVIINYDNIPWMLPIPASFPAKEGAMNFKEKILNGTYPY